MQLTISKVARWSYRKKSTSDDQSTLRNIAAHWESLKLLDRVRESGRSQINTNLPCICMRLKLGILNTLTNARVVRLNKEILQSYHCLKYSHCYNTNHYHLIYSTSDYPQNVSSPQHLDQSEATPSCTSPRPLRNLAITTILNKRWMHGIESRKHNHDLVPELGFIQPQNISGAFHFVLTKQGRNSQRVHHPRT